MPLAYSYIRFSTKDQLQGDSLRRQTELSERYCEEHGLTLAEAPFEDKGVSAFKGSHAATGALSDFTRLVDSGRIKAGSYLLVESFDRLSREDTDTAMARFLELRSKGIVIVTLADNKVFDKTSDTSKMTMDLMYSLMIMGRAHEESQMKSKRLSAAWSAKRKKAQEENAPMSRKCPAWIELVDGKYRLIPEKAKVVKYIVDMTLAGIGKGTVTRSLNRNGVPPFGRGQRWWDSYIQKILESPALYGTYQPKQGGVPDGSPIDNYYPAVIDKDTFYKMRAARATPIARGRKGKVFTNLLSGIATCSKCSGNLGYFDKGKPPKGYCYLICLNKVGGICDSKYARYDQIELLALLVLSQIDLSMIVEPEKVGNERSDIEHAIDEIQSKIDNFTAVIGSGSLSIIDALKAAEQEKDRLLMSLEELSVEEQSSPHLNELQSVIDELSGAEGDELYQIRERLHRLLNGAVESFVLDADLKHIDVRLKDYSDTLSISEDITGWTAKVSPSQDQ